MMKIYNSGEIQTLIGRVRAARAGFDKIVAECAPNAGIGGMDDGQPFKREDPTAAIVRCSIENTVYRLKKLGAFSVRASRWGKNFRDAYFATEQAALNALPQLVEVESVFRHQTDGRSGEILIFDNSFYDHASDGEETSDVVKGIIKQYGGVSLNYRSLIMAEKEAFFFRIANPEIRQIKLVGGDDYTDLIERLRAFGQEVNDLQPIPELRTLLQEMNKLMPMPDLRGRVEAILRIFDDASTARLTEV